MTVPSQTPVNTYVANGVTTTFAYGFKLLDQVDIKVSVAGVVKTLGVDYTVTGVGVDAGGTIVFTVAPANLAAIELLRNVTVQRLIDYQYSGDFQSPTVNRDFDRIVMMIQDSGLSLANSLRFPLGDTASGLLPNAATRALKGLAFDAAGNVVVTAAAGNADALAAALLSTTATTGGALVGFNQANTYPAGSIALAVRNAAAFIDDLDNLTDVAKGAALLAYKLNATGSVGRTLASRLSDTVSVKDFGAVGNGIADDTAAIQAALNTGKVVRAPAGDYKITAPLTMTQGGGIVGDGEATSFIRFFTGGQMIRHPGGNQYKSPILLKDFSITKDASITVVAGDTGIDIGYSTAWGGRGEISNILILYQWDGFKWKAGTMNLITNVQVIECKGNGFYGINPRGELTGCLSQFNGGHGYFFYAQDAGETGIQLTSCGTFANFGYGYLFDGVVQGANVYLKGITSSFDRLGGLRFQTSYIQIWMTQVFIEYCGEAFSVYPSFPVQNDSRGLAFIAGVEKLVGSDINILNCRGGGAYFSTVSSASLANMVVIANGRGGLGGDNATGLSFAADNNSFVIQGLIANSGANQTADIAYTSSNNAANISDAFFRTLTGTPGPNVRFSNPATTASVAVAAASVVTLPNYSDYVTVSGTTLIDSVAASWAGRRVTLKFDSTASVADGNNMRLNGVFSGTADDTLTIVCDGTNWYECARSAN